MQSFQLKIREQLDGTGALFARNPRIDGRVPDAVKTICFPAMPVIKINNARGIVSEKFSGCVRWVDDVDVSFVCNRVEKKLD